MTNTPDNELAVMFRLFNRRMTSSYVPDHLWERQDLDMNRLAVGGISFGEMVACKAAAFDERVKAAVSISEWHTPSRTFQPGPVTLRALRHYVGDDPKSILHGVSPTGVTERVHVPLLQVYGGLTASHRRNRRTKSSGKRQARRRRSSMTTVSMSATMSGTRRGPRSPTGLLKR